MTQKLLQLHAIFCGRVQGVCFRLITKEYADKLQITGTVKNLPSGEVELFAQGSKNQLQQLLDSLTKESGPGHVTKVNKTLQEPTTTFTDFSIIY